MLGIELRSFEKQPVLLTADPTLQPFSKVLVHEWAPMTLTFWVPAGRSVGRGCYLKTQMTGLKTVVEYVLGTLSAEGHLKWDHSSVGLICPSICLFIDRISHSPCWFQTHFITKGVLELPYCWNASVS